MKSSAIVPVCTQDISILPTKIINKIKHVDPKIITANTTKYVILVDYCYLQHKYALPNAIAPTGCLGRHESETTDETLKICTKQRINDKLVEYSLVGDV